jgi:NADH:ubiquinone oxidoreductase subunit E
MSSDRHYRLVNRVMRVHDNQPDAPIETLHAMQDSFAFLDVETMAYVAHERGVVLSRVFAVASFYHYFSLRRPGEHTCVVCLGTACYIGGSSDILETIREQVGIVPRETTADGKISLIIATGNNNLAINRGILPVVRRFVKGGTSNDAAANRIQAMIRAFDPCPSCSTHALTSEGPIIELIHSHVNHLG